MNYNYLVTTNINSIPQDKCIVMIDGTVPGWIPKPGDLHFDHHRPGGAPVQIEEIPASVKVPEDAVFVTTQLDADAQVAAAYLQLDIPKESIIYKKLWAIAHDCDHLGLPVGEEYDAFRDFARNAVAALKQSSDNLLAEMNLPKDKSKWSEEDRENFMSRCFKFGVEWLIAAAKGKCPWPGESGEAKEYFDRQERLRPLVYQCCYIFHKIAVFDHQEFVSRFGFRGAYIDPRLFIDWCRERDPQEKFLLPATIMVRDGSSLPGSQELLEYNYSSAFMYQYTLGSIPLHRKGSPRYSDRGIWKFLADHEITARSARNLPLPETSWGGRNEVGGSGWRDPSIMESSLIAFHLARILENE